MPGGCKIPGTVRLRAALFGAALPLLACNACGPNVPILMYHSIGDAPDAYAVSEKDFTAHLDYLKSAGFDTISLNQLVEHQDHKAPLPEHPIVITFDDGFQDAYTRAFPLLQARGQKASFFVVTRFVADDEARRRVDAKGTPQQRAYLIWREVREMAAAGMEIGSHSLWHRRLPDMGVDQIRDDVQRSREEIE